MFGPAPLVKCDICRESKAIERQFKFDDSEPDICFDCHAAHKRKVYAACKGKCPYPACSMSACSPAVITREKGSAWTTVSYYCDCPCHEQLEVKKL